MVESGGGTAGNGSEYPLLKADIETADRILGPDLAKADRRAGNYQRRFRYSELAIIYGGVVAVALGVVSAAGTNDVASWLETLLTAGLAALAFVSGGLKWHQHWVKERSLAEELRGERFLFIGRVAEYADAAEPERVLRQRVVGIERRTREVAQNV